MVPIAFLLTSQYNQDMSFKMVVGEDFPQGAWILDSSGPAHADYSGYARNGMSSATIYGPALISGAARSLIITNATKFATLVPVFVAGKEEQPFSLEATVRPLGTGSEQQVLGRDGQMDGIVVNGTVVSFVTKFSTTGEARASYDMKALQAIHVVGVHTKESNALFINGEMVAQVDITAEQQADTFAGSPITLGCGASSSSTTSIMVNGLAVYNSALEYDSILIHYDKVEQGESAEDIAISYGGHLLEVSPALVASRYDIDWSLDEDWNEGGLVAVSAREDSLFPEEVDGVTEEGRWMTAVPLTDAGTSIYAVSVKWEGDGVIVQTSRDNINWVDAENGVNISTVTPTTSTADLMLYLQVIFPAGRTLENTYLDSLSVTVHPPSPIPEVAGREVVLDNVSIEIDADVKTFHQDWGFELRNGTITIKASTDAEKFNPKTIEVWSRKDGTTFADNLVTGSPTRWRTNGGASESYRTGEWQLRHYVFDSGFTGDIVFNGTGQIGHVIMYEDALTNDEIKEIYDAYCGAPTKFLTNSDSLNIYELAGQVDIYEYEWAIEASG